MYYNFSQDLQIAKKYENRAKKILEPAYGELKSCADSRCDLYNDSVSFEVKTDFVSKRTNYLGVEYKDRDKLAGISVTEADNYFVFVFDKSWSQTMNKLDEGIRKDGWWLGIEIETEVLKELARRPYLKRARGGDDNNTLMVLVPVEDVREYSIDIHPITPGVLT